MFITRNKYGLVLMLLCLFFTGCSLQDRGASAEVAQSPETIKQIERFNQMGDEIYNKTLKGQFLEARAEIIQMSELTRQIRLNEVITASGLKAISETLTQAITVFNAVQLDTEQALFQSARIRLMADAISHPRTPMWLQFNKVIQEDINVMEQASKQKKYQDLKLAFNQLKLHYLTIQPALQVGLQTEEINKIVSAIHNVESELLSDSTNPSNLSHSINTLQDEMEGLFQIKSEAAAYLPFMETKEPMLNWLIILASIIIIVLGFVAWRMRVARNGIISIRR
jgi:sporulation protein YpjB